MTHANNSAEMNVEQTMHELRLMAEELAVSAARKWAVLPDHLLALFHKKALSLPDDKFLEAAGYLFYSRTPERQDTRH